MKKKSRLYLLLTLPFLLILTTLWQGTITGMSINREAGRIPQESGALSVHFCSVENCEELLVTLINQSNKTECAFYDLDDKKLEQLFAEKSAKGEAELLIFEKNWRANMPGRAVPSRHGGLMHDKFCILDADDTARATVVTGSANPTQKGLFKNNNNIIVISGSAIVQNYLEEYEELKGGRENKVKYPIINHTDALTNNSLLIENYFCPEDNCEEEVLTELKKAAQSISFMTFSFTSDAIGDLLVKKEQQGVIVRGVFEKRQKSRYSEYEKLKSAGLKVRFDGNPATMHHKVFIIDADDPAKATSIAGSYNPTRNGNTRNDENILIIHDRKITGAYAKEFGKVWKETQ